MNRLPRELIDRILLECVHQGTKNEVLESRLVCRAFDRFLKPYTCKTVGLVFSRLSRASTRRLPDQDALDTIGRHCRALYVDMMALREDTEVEYLSALFESLPSMQGFIQHVQRAFCMGPTSFTEVDFRLALERILFSCSAIDHLRIDLPSPLVGQSSNAATMILAITFAAFNRRLQELQEDAVPLRTIVLQGISSQIGYSLWTNPQDVLNIMKVFRGAENLVLAVRHTSSDPQLVDFFAIGFWGFVRAAGALRSLCIVGVEDGHRPPRHLKQNRAWEMDVDVWICRTLPVPRSAINLPLLTRLELKRLDIAPDVLWTIARTFGPSLRELFLNEVYLKVEQGLTYNTLSDNYLWVGLPNRYPRPGQRWMAMVFRQWCQSLQICRASFLGYDQLIRADALNATALAETMGIPHPVNADPPLFSNPGFDFADPSGLGRTVAQRFVEVVLGYEQPKAAPPEGGPVHYYPCPDLSTADAESTAPAPPPEQPRPVHLTVTDCDANAYHVLVGGLTSSFLWSIDGVFPNTKKESLDDMQYLSSSAAQGITEMQGRRERHEDLGNQHQLQRYRDGEEDSNEEDSNEEENEDGPS